MGMRDLEGQTLLLTGVTGFLGTAVLEKLLRDVAGVRVLCLIRPGRHGAEARLRNEVLGSDACTTLRERLGAHGIDGLIGSRVVALAGDLGRVGLGLAAADRDLLAGVDVIVHSAAEVSFDSALDVALRTNLEGPVRLLDAVLLSGATPAVVQVSTAYVGGLRRGLVLEGGPGGLAAAGGACLDWRAELEAAETVRRRLEAESRSPQRMRRLAAQAKRGPGGGGVPAASAETERLRERWVAERLVAHGRAHARALGWSDVYTMSKAMAELAVADRCAALPLSIVRPCIIESAIAEPRPGWITGLRMAEPIIIAYGRGLLPEFPGLPDGVVDLIPVDHVANAVIAAAAHPPPASTPRVLHVGTGARNPLRFRALLEHTRDHFRAHPLHDAGGAPIPVPDWTYPAQHTADRRLLLLQRALSGALSAVERAPSRSSVRDVHRRLEDAHERVTRGRELARMYAVYTSMDAIFDDTNLVELDRSRPADERTRFPCDAGGLDWAWYLQESHIPAITALARLRRRPPRQPAAGPTVSVGTPEPPPRLRAPEPERPTLAVFDVEGTLCDLTVLTHRLFVAMDLDAATRWPSIVTRAAFRIPGWIRMDRRDRLDFQRSFYRGYEGVPRTALEDAARRALHEVTLPRCFPAGLRRVRDHVAAGHRVVLVSGALDEIVRPLAELLEVEVRGARLRDRDGVFDGDLAETPPTNEARGALVQRLAAETGADLRDCWAYADSVSDLSMLDLVGHPVPVNPDLRLASIGRKRGWPTQIWTVRDGGIHAPVVAPAAVHDGGSRHLARIR